MQLLTRTIAPDFAAWKAAFDAEGENIAASGLSVLQIWKGEKGAVLVLFEVHDPALAQDWLTKQAGFGHALDAEFLRTA